ncbi:MAG: hypothetical protein ABI723_06950 [Bacteroidia bacterium]
MNTSLLVETNAWLISVVLFLFMMLAVWLGFKAGIRKRKQDSDKEHIADTNTLTGLLFFLLAFTFGMSGSRFETRRSVVVEESNDIGTAILRADLYPAEERKLFREDFKEYVDARIKFYEVGFDLENAASADSLSQSISAKLWTRAARLAADPANLAATQQMIPALNTMIDITTTRFAGEKGKVPESILFMLFFLAFISAFYGGYTAGRKGHIDWLVEIGFCLLISLVVLFTLDLDRPRRGFVNLDSVNQNIINLRSNFK